MFRNDSSHGFGMKIEFFKLNDNEFGSVVKNELSKISILFKILSLLVL